MCGICGLVDFSGRVPDTGTLSRMTQTLLHRGPDDSGVHLSPPAGLGHTRLSVIDLSAQAHQPMLSADGQVAITYNGEIYNFQELKRRLEADGVRFQTQSDTELALKAYQTWGTGAFKTFNGMFALAIWDGTRRQLHLARDRFGIKPLYYHQTRREIVFGSEIKALLASGRLDRRVNPQALHEYLYYGAALGEGAMFRDVAKLLPGHYATFDEQGFRTAPYVSIHEVPPVSGSAASIAEEIRHHLDQSVKRHLISDVPVGVFLSGGIDSSTLTAFASRHYAGRLSTFSVDYDFEVGPSELAKARSIAQLFGTDHHELRITSHNIPAVIERLVGCHDEPFGDAADIPLYLLAEQVRGQIKVILQGDGGDEMFGGYRRYAVLSWERAWRALASAAGPFLRSLRPSPARHRLERFAAAVGHPDPAMRMALLLTDESEGWPPTRVLTGEARQGLAGTDPFRRYRELHARLRHLDPVQRMLYVDCAIMLPDIYFEKVDKATMAHGLEVRVPFLDNDLAAHAMGIPSRYKVRHGRKKWILKLAMRGILPDAILDAPKMGFGVPYAQWLRGPLRGYMESVLLEAGVTRGGFFDPAALKRCVDEHVTGTRDNGFLLWKVLNLQLWSKQYAVDLRAR